MIKILVVLLACVFTASSYASAQQKVVVPLKQNQRTGEQGPIDPLVASNFIVLEEVGDKIKKWGEPVGGTTHSIGGPSPRSYYIAQYQSLNPTGRLLLRRAVFQNIESDAKKPAVYILIWLFDGWLGDDKKPKLQWVWDLQKGSFPGKDPPENIKDVL